MNWVLGILGCMSSKAYTGYHRLHQYDSIFRLSDSHPPTYLSGIQQSLFAADTEYTNPQLGREIRITHRRYKCAMVRQL